MNLNKLAKDITLLEGKKINLTIAQVKEVLRLLLKEFAKEDIAQVEKVLKRYR